ncbi:MAG: hypothetical protein FWG87_05045 [Defluviitaleaceae bacterium]|nr:hypothetical protein [Defluviitaleaceae bacterium]
MNTAIIMANVYPPPFFSNCLRFFLRSLLSPLSVFYVAVSLDCIIVLGFMQMFWGVRGAGFVGQVS